MSNDLITTFLGIAIFLLIASSVIMHASMNAAKAKKDLRNPYDCNDSNKLNNSDDVDRGSV
ncbi:MAG TPA: hypothetical protein VH500_19910 [Nitrososphaeraceae archaeon]